MTRRSLVPVLLSVVVVLLGVPTVAEAGGGGGGGSACNGFAEGPVVELRDSCISGTAHVADEGPIVVRNTGSVQHNLVAVDGSFATPVLDSGDEATVDLAPGVHLVYCTLHGAATGGGMAGAVIVGDGLDVSLIAAAGGREHDDEDPAWVWWPLAIGGVVVMGTLITVGARRSGQPD